jgi:hypothetical protein
VNIKKLSEKALAEAKAARAKLRKQEVVFVGNAANPEGGKYLSNYAAGLLNRQMDIFDDCILLLQHDRIPAACVLSRGMIETYALAMYAAHTIKDILTKDESAAGAELAVQKTIAFTNSSRFKVTEQKRFKKGVFTLDGYTFTEEAKQRLQLGLATNEQITNALLHLYDAEMKETDRTESRFQLLYGLLSEWVHPSQTSLWHNYAHETQSILTSIGNVQVHDAAKNYCAQALHFMTATDDMYQHMVEMADAISRLERRV